MDVFTVSFFGHRRIDNMSAIEEKLDEILCDIIENNNFVEFLVGREGDFDIIVASVIRRVTKRLDRKNSVMTLVLPYMKSDYQKTVSIISIIMTKWKYALNLLMFTTRRQYSTGTKALLIAQILLFFMLSVMVEPIKQ